MAAHLIVDQGVAGSSPAVSAEWGVAQFGQSTRFGSEGPQVQILPSQLLYLGERWSCLGA